MATSDWHLAGFTDDYRRLGKLIGSGTISVPGSIEVDCKHDALRWSHKERGKHVKPEPTMLHEFVRLWELTPAAIERFARRWGVLYLDETGRPCQTNASLINAMAQAVKSGLPGRKYYEEPLSSWRYFSRRAASVLNIAAALQDGKVGDLDDWAALRGTSSTCGSLLSELSRYSPGLMFLISLERDYPFGATDFGKANFTRSVKQERRFLMVEMYAWLKMGRVGFVVVPDDEGWTVQLDFNSCFSLSNCDAASVNLGRN